MGPEAGSDQELIARCLQHDEDAWRALLDRYASYIYTIITRAYGLAGEEAQDAFQESLVKAFEGLPGYRGEGEFRAWLRQVVRNSCAAHLRRQRPTEPISDEIPDRAQEEVLERIERAYTLTRVLRELDDPCRQIIALFFFKGQTYKAIATALAIPEGTVGSRLSRCLTKLRANVREET